MELVNDKQYMPDSDADTAECTQDLCPIKWKFGFNFVGEVLLFKIKLAAGLSQVCIYKPAPHHTTPHHSFHPLAH